MENSIDQALLEILRMARELTINEYKDRRAELHNRWLAESERMWRMSRARLVYPTIPPHPTETEILARAKILMNFVAVSVPDTELVQVAEPIVDVLPTIVTPLMVEVEPESPPIVTSDLPLKTTPPESLPPGGILPSVRRRLEEMKAGWK
jgi:hypothetical protein